MLAVAGGFVVYFVFMWKRLTDPYEGPPSALLGDSRIMQPGFRGRCGRPTRGDDAIVVEVIHTADKAAWLERAAEQYMALCPNTQLKLRTIEDMEAIDEIARGAAAPTLWAPSSQLAVRYLEERWEHAARGIPLRIDEGPPLLKSPTVLFLWEDRLRALEPLVGGWDVRGRGWARSICGGLPLDSEPVNPELNREAMVPGTWLAWKQRDFGTTPSRVHPDRMLQRWGHVAIEHSSPSRALLGLSALSLMAYDFIGATSPEGVVVDENLGPALELGRPALLRWLRRCEAGRQQPLSSAHLLTESMFNLNERYDGVVTSEQLAFEILNKIHAHGTTMRRAQIVYPEANLVSDHPLVFFGPDDPTTSEAVAAARRFSDYLRSASVQTSAIERGFRPTNPSVVIRDYDVKANPFLGLRAFGVELEPRLKELPRLSGQELRGLIEAWEDATRQN